jgi:hypothetical protein
MAEFEPYLESLCRGQVPIKVAISFFCFLEVAEDADGAVNHSEILADSIDRPSCEKAVS